MDKILEINGIKYIQKAEYDKAQKDLKNVKKIVSASIANLTGFLNDESVDAKPKVAKATVAKTTVSKKTVAKKPTTKRSKVYSLRSKHLSLYPSEIAIYSDLKMNKDGEFHGYHNRPLKFNIRHVISINKEYCSSTTTKDVAKWAREFGFTMNTIHRIIYNLDHGTFVDFIKEYLSSANDISIKHKQVETQNNPQKRKEAGIYS